MNLLISACLLGVECRYSGTGCLNDKVKKLSEKHHLIPVCPEQLSGLPTPRDPVERINGRAITCNGADCTKQFLDGAEAAVRISKQYHCKAAVLKSRSPSCGFGTIYDGTFSGKLTSGDGFTAEKLKAEGLPIYSEENCESLFA